MGRHDDPDPTPFYTSLGSAILRGLLALFLSFGLYGVIASIRSELPRSAAVSRGDTAAGRAAPDASPAPTSAPVQKAEPVQKAAARVAPVPSVPSVLPSEAATDDLPASADTTIQVLDGGAGDRRIEQVVGLLEEFGYRVVAVNDAVRVYGVTTVFYSDGHQEAGRGLQARDPRFAAVRSNPNLNQAVNLHVVVGTDWR